MNSRMRLALALSTILGAAALASAASAQQAPPPAPPSSGAAAAAPPAPPPAPPSGQAPGPRRPGFNLLGRLGRLSPEDRAAVIDARFAAIKAGLELTSTQEPLWAPVEKAIRDGFNQAMALRATFQKEGPPADPMQRLQRAAELASARATSLQNFVNAAQPLYASLTPAQKGRLPLLLGVARGIGPGAGVGRQGPGPRPGAGLGEGGRNPPLGGPGPMGRGPGRGEDNMRAPQGPESAGPDTDWRERMRRRMEEMNRDRREWRRPDWNQRMDQGSDYSSPSDRQSGQGEEN